MKSITIIAALSSLIHANPISAPPSISSAVCAVDKLILNALTAFPSARSSALSFCSSYISVPPVTVVSSTSVTTTVTTITPLTTTTETTSTAYATTTAIDPTISAFNGWYPVKRAAPLPTPLALLPLAAAQISQACSCISGSIPLVTTTVTSTYTQNATSTASTSIIVATPTETCSLDPIVNGDPSITGTGNFFVTNLDLCPDVASYQLSFDAQAVTAGDDPGTCLWEVFYCSDGCDEFFRAPSFSGVAGLVPSNTVAIQFFLTTAGYASCADTGNYVNNISLVASNSSFSNNF